MGNQNFINQPETSLLTFLKVSNEVVSEESLAKLIAEYTETTIKNVIRSKLRVSLNHNDKTQRNQDALEIINDVQALLISHLRNLKSQNGYDSINNFKSYTASAAFNACHQYLRRINPVRSQLKYKLRYLLTHHRDFALWQNTEGEFVCGFDTRQFRARERVAKIQVSEEIKSFFPNILNQTDAANERKFYTELLTAIFNHINAPVVLNELVTLIFELRGIQEPSEIAETDGQGENSFYNRIADSKQNQADELEGRERLKRLWEEICQLPPRHRAALLLNLKDKAGESVITFLPLLRIATIRQIAEVLDFSPEHFATVWNGLPWEDLKIAEHLGVTRQQVINLRQSARARLGRLIKEN